MSWLPSFSPGLDADILLYGEDERKIVEVKGEKEGRRETCPVYYDGESVKGQVSRISLPLNDESTLRKLRGQG